MDFTQVAIGVVAVIAVIVLYKILKSIISTVMFIITVISVLLLVSSVLLIIDTSSFKSNFAEGNKLYLLKENQVILAGFIQGKNFSEATGMAEYTRLFASKDFKAMLAGNYKLIIIDMEALQNTSLPVIDVSNGQLSKQDVLALLRMEKPSSSLLLYGTSLSDEKVKALLFAPMVASMMKDQVGFISQYRNNTVIIYPESALFKFLRYFPIKPLAKALGSAADKAEKI